MYAEETAASYVTQSVDRSKGAGMDFPVSTMQMIPAKPVIDGIAETAPQ
jgi:hypothetical protein